MSSNTSFFHELMTTVAERGRELLPRGIFRAPETDAGLQTLASALMSGRGEASGIAIAQQLLRHYSVLDMELKSVFFQYIDATLKPDPARVQDAATAYLNMPSERRLEVLQKTLESPRQEFFRRLNMAPGATSAIVTMRADLLSIMRTSPELTEKLSGLNRDLVHLLESWFNRGFLVLRSIDWHTPAAILEKIIEYEAVHEIRGWNDLRRRLDPRDRRCFAFFHPSMADEPLIFVEVALVQDISDNVQAVLREESAAPDAPLLDPTTAVFYSISNCQKGLRGISFGNFLIKQVVEELSRECPTLRNFATLSPIPGFAKWLQSVAAQNMALAKGDDSAGGVGHQQEPGATGTSISPAGQTSQDSDDATGKSPNVSRATPAHLVFDEAEHAAIAAVKQTDWHRDPETVQAIQPAMMTLAAEYFVNEKTSNGHPIDPVARFHLGNGARLERINWQADTSQHGLAQSYGMMVNYLYELKDIEQNHEAYANEHVVSVSRGVRSLVRTKHRMAPPVNKTAKPVQADGGRKAESQLGGHQTAAVQSGGNAVGGTSASDQSNSDTSSDA